MKLFKSFNNGEKLLFDCCIIMLGGIEFARKVSNRTALLFDNRAKLIFTGIRFNIERQGVVLEDQESIRSDKSFHTLKGFLMGWSPDKGSFSSKLGERCQDMGMMGPHVAVVIDHAEEGTKLFHVHGRLEMQDSIHLLSPWFDTFWT